MTDPNAKSSASIADIERQMAEMLENSASGPKETIGRPTAPTSIHRVEMDEIKSIPRTPPDPDGNLKLILDIAVEVRVEVGNSRLTISELLNLAPGSIIELDRTAGSPADLLVNGTKVGQGDVVVVDESYGIRLTKLVDPQDRINSL